MPDDDDDDDDDDEMAIATVTHFSPSIPPIPDSESIADKANI